MFWKAKKMKNHLHRCSVQGLNSGHWCHGLVKLTTTTITTMTARKKESGKIGSGREALHLPAPRKSNPVNEAAMEVDLRAGRQEGQEEGREKKRETEAQRQLGSAPREHLLSLQFKFFLFRFFGDAKECRCATCGSKSVRLSGLFKSPRSNRLSHWEPTPPPRGASWIAWPHVWLEGLITP